MKNGDQEGAKWETKMGACATKKQAINPGSALDRVISQASSDDCVLYRLADYKKGEKNCDVAPVVTFLELVFIEYL